MEPFAGSDPWNGAQDLAGERCAGSGSSKEIDSQILRTVPPRGQEGTEEELNPRLQHPSLGIGTPRPHAASPRLARPHARANETKRLSSQTLAP